MTRMFRGFKWLKSKVLTHPAAYNALPLPPQISALLADIPGGERNLLPRSAWLLPLRVDIPMWENSSPSLTSPERLSLHWGDVLVEEKTWTTPVQPGELFFMVPQTRLIEGEHSLYYTVVTSNGESADSQLLTLIIDKTPPLLADGEAPLLFPAEVVSGGVSEQYLNTHEDQLLAEVPDYLEPRPGDIITWYWSASPTGSELVGSKTLQSADMGQPIILVFTGDLIRGRGDGPRYASYKLEDRSGNAGARSLAVQLQVCAQPVPRVLPPPKVKEASGSATTSTLDPGRAINGATVVILPEATIRPGEQVFVQWAERDSLGSYRAEATQAPGETRIPNTCIAQHFAKSIKVLYEVFESGVTDPHTSRIHTLNVSSMTGFPPPQCDKVANSQLNLADVTDYANFTLEDWSFMATDQFINLEVRGVDSSNENIKVTVLSQYPVPEVAERIDVGRISKADLQRFKLNEGLVVRVAVSFDGKLTWIDFPELRPTLVDHAL